MIKKLFSIALLAATFSVSAQQLRIGKEVASNQIIAAKGGNQSPLSVTIDTLRPASMMAGGCAVSTNTAVNGFYNYINDRVAPYDSGYIFGTGIIPLGGTTSTSAVELAQKYNCASAGTTVTDVLVIAGKAKGGTTTTVAKIYSEAAGTHKPNTQIGSSSVALPMSSYTTSAYTAFHFATAVPVPVGNFFAAVTVPAFGGTDHDTLSILCTHLGACPASGSDSCSAIKLGAPYGWYLVKVGFGKNGDLAIFPVIDITTTGVNNYVSKGNLDLYAASPNPASNSININFSLANSSKVDIEVYDVTGNVVKTVKGGAYTAGKGSVAVDVTNLSAGSYIYSITTNGSKMFSRFVVAK